jgi:phosphoribosylformimino-5-aminoimidazole carboxamide ribotide isomerase
VLEAGRECGGNGVIVMPAIDLRAGRCVRLVRGDFSTERVYGDDPVRVAQEWYARGASWLHLVDLDGAAHGVPAQLDLIASIVAAVPGMRVQLGGGLRTLEDLDAAFVRGVTRVIVGTAAVESPDFLGLAVERYGSDRVMLGVDARRGKVAVRGWLQTTDVPVEAVIETAVRLGIQRVLYTDIERDGTLSAPNFEVIAALGRFGVAVVASGGIASREHLWRLALLPHVEAAIVGRALYDGTIVCAGPEDWWIGATTAEGAA